MPPNTLSASSGKKVGEFYTPQQISDILSAIVTLDSQEPATGKKDRLASVLDFASGSGSLLLNVREAHGAARDRQDFRPGKQHHDLQPRPHEHASARVKDTEFEIFHDDTLANDWDILQELNPAKKRSFDAIVANPPWSWSWSSPGSVDTNRLSI
jgi:type I restriction enzyme M protein